MWKPTWLFGRRKPGSFQRSPSYRRTPLGERLEPRNLMAATPIHVGVTYLETDYLETDSDAGNDSRPDRFILSFAGGAPNTELSELRISTDKAGDGLSIGDLIFDTKSGGRGKEGFGDFRVVRADSQTGTPITAVAQVEDGGTELVIRFTGFKAGDRLEFTIDVDQILRLSPDLGIFNSGLDTISSGQEFEDSILKAVFKAPHFEVATGTDLFINDYGDPRARFGLDLPADNGPESDSRPNRTAAAVASVTQVPKPISLSGTVWADDNLNLRRESNEQTLPGVQVSLWTKDVSGRFVDTGLKQITDSNGRYHFSTALGLKPGEYQVIQSQPTGFFSVGAVVGQVGSQTVGNVLDVNTLTGISIPLGDTHAVNYDFAEARPAEIGGFVYRDDNDNGRKDNGEVGLAGVRMRLVPVNTLASQAPLETTTTADGSYSFTGLVPGRYEIIQVTQPTGLTDGRDSAGTISGTIVGVADEPGDAIRQIDLTGNARGVNYNFGELPLGSISGGVYLAAPGDDCGLRDDGRSTPLAGVVVELQTANGVFVARTTTGADGQYRFDNVPKGIYNLIEITPAGLLDGLSHVGTIDGVPVGTSANGGNIRLINLPAGRSAIHYDFCEAAPGSLSGFVYHDASNDGQRAANETPIAGVRIELVNQSGSVVATTTTRADGSYLFENLLPGTYSIRETQPTGFIDGLDRAGTIGGILIGAALNPGDLISGVTLKQGQHGVEYNFGELRTASIAGRVHVDDDGDCVFDLDETPLQGVRIRVLDSNGREVATTTTDATGRYKVDGLVPGTYTVVEEQPEGYFEGGAKPGSAGGLAETPSRIGSITLTSGEVAVDYDFCERPPAEISGIVFVDRDLDCLQDPGERPLQGVRVDLLDAEGRIVATTTTDASGSYRFTNLPAGTYTLRETQPIGFLQGGQSAGSAGGDVSQADIISSIPIAFGDRLTHYNFCELEPSSISGQVFVDLDQDCVPDEDEARLAGVTIQLYDISGRLVATTQTDAQGQYEFTNLVHGQYRIVELQPPGFFSGNAIPGSGGGRADGSNIITEISIGPGTTLVNYDFCELPPGSISGSVWSETDLNQQRDQDDRALPGVTVQLLDPLGNVLATMQTDANGSYRFDNLVPGTYAVRQLQPVDLFHGGQLAGSLGGDASADNLIQNIQLPPGVEAKQYDFPEFPPATISGVVFQDGAPITTETAPSPLDLRKFKDGQFTTDDLPLPGVVLELRNVLGQPFTADRALPGVYADGPIRVVTAADGSYEFKGLRPGSYHVYQVQPDSFIDSLDTPGTTGGIAVNLVDVQNDPQTLAFIRTLSADSQTDPANDAILNILLTAGGVSTSNNFSEVLIEQPPVPAPPIVPPPLPATPLPPPPLSPFDPFPKVYGDGSIARLRPPIVADAEYAVTWHLSVINGGFPRGSVAAEAAAKVVSVADFGTNFKAGEHRAGRWLFVDQAGKRIESMSDVTLGDEDAVPLTGDFNGDGSDEVAIFVGGQWFVDLNGNGTWDAGDMWLRLGTKLDRPVVGDWDGDGKDDIAIFGPQWQHDPEAIVHDPGLPDPDNLRRRKAMVTVSNRKPELEEPRYLRTGDGPLRADAIDHVFRYGEQPDTPLSGDWNGDGIDSIAVFRAGEWRLDLDGDGRWTAQDKEVTFGDASDTPLVGDWNGDGIDDLGVMRGDVWIIDSDGDHRLTGNDKQIKIERPSEDAIPVVGDWNGDGKDEIGWYRDAA